MKIAVIQMNSQDDLEMNLEFVEQSAKISRVEDRADMIVLPEYFAFLDDNVERWKGSAAAFEHICRRLSKISKRYGIFIHGGSIVEPAGDKIFNTTLAFDPDGAEVARYRKLHLFDYDNPNGTRHRESEIVARGAEVVTYKAGDLTIGCTICYDIRFPELFQRLREQGADVIVLPAAFTMQTGKDHWEILLRARAIETQTYIVASAQIFYSTGNRRQSWGHSMIVDPWGHIVAQSSDMVGNAVARISPAYIAKIRTAMPVAQHRVLLDGAPAFSTGLLA